MSSQVSVMTLTVDGGGQGPITQAFLVLKDRPRTYGISGQLD